VFEKFDHMTSPIPWTAKMRWLMGKEDANCFSEMNASFNDDEGVLLLLFEDCDDDCCLEEMEVGYPLTIDILAPNKLLFLINKDFISFHPINQHNKSTKSTNQPTNQPINQLNQIKRFHNFI